MDTGLPVSVAQRRLVAKQLKRYWDQRPGDGIYRSSDVLIDLNAPQGRSEMLVLAVLKAAKIREGVAEKAFLALRSEGLLAQERLVEADPADIERVETILREQYRAQISKRAKTEALFQNQRRLVEDWGGDLHHVYLAHRGDGSAIVTSLQQFQQIASRAVWLCREMAAAGVWKGLAPESTAYLDIHVRQPLFRLGLAKTCKGTSWENIRQECMYAIDQYFDGDLIALARHGSTLCRQEALHVCQTECTVNRACSFWQDGSSKVQATEKLQSSMRSY